MSIFRNSDPTLAVNNQPVFQKYLRKASGSKPGNAGIFMFFQRSFLSHSYSTSTNSLKLERLGRSGFSSVTRYEISCKLQTFIFWTELSFSAILRTQVLLAPRIMAFLICTTSQSESVTPSSMDKLFVPNNSRSTLISDNWLITCA